jgi:hypothetical protein
MGRRFYHHFLAGFATAVVPKGAAIVAAGHAACYALMLARERPGVWSHAVLLAPTWRGPLPIAMAEHPSAYAWVRRLVGTPVIGEALYRLNALRPVIGLIYRRHVYSDASRVTPAFVAKKQHVARRPGARFRSVAFVTGHLDPVSGRAALLHSSTLRPCRCWCCAALLRHPNPRRKWQLSPNGRASISAGSRDRLVCTRNTQRQLPTRSFAFSTRPRRRGSAFRQTPEDLQGLVPRSKIG